MDNHYPFAAKQIMTWGVVAACTLSTAAVHGQGARLVLNDGGVVRIDNDAWLVVQNGAANAITTLPNLATGGVIRSEGEFNRVRWNIGTNTGNYELPYVSSEGERIPFRCNIPPGNAGTGGANASLTFSTYNHRVGGATWNNDAYRPWDVTHMHSHNTGDPTSSDGELESKHVVDRFWIIDHGIGTHPGTAPYAYTTPPNPIFDFTYSTTDDVQTGNLILSNTELRAQRFNTDMNAWGDVAPGVGTWALGSVTVAPSSVGFYRSWTLSAFEHPLPVRLVHFSSVCEAGKVILSWVTASEQNSLEFNLERSTDNISFETIGTVAAAGNSSSPIHYSFVDHAPPGLAYYRLHQVDRDARSELGPVSVAGCDDNGSTEIVNAWDDGHDLNVLVSASGDQQHLIRLFDAGGKEVWHQAAVPLPSGMTTVRIPKNDIARGIYVVRFDGPEGPMARRVAVH